MRDTCAAAAPLRSTPHHQQAADSADNTDAGILPDQLID